MRSRICVCVKFVGERRGGGGKRRELWSLCFVFFFTASLFSSSYSSPYPYLSYQVS